MGENVIFKMKPDLSIVKNMFLKDQQAYHHLIKIKNQGFHKIVSKLMVVLIK